MSKELYENLLARFGESIGAEGVHPDKQGYCSIEIDADYEIHLQYDPQEERVIFFTELGEVNPDYKSETHQALLEANLLWTGTRGCTLALNPVTQKIEMANRLSVSVEFSRFEEVIYEFVQTTEAWKTKLKALPAAWDEAEESESESPDTSVEATTPVLDPPENAQGQGALRV